MRRILLITILLMLAIWSCKSVKVDTDIGRTSVEKTEKNKVDSVAVTASKIIESQAKTMLSELSDFKLSSVLDSVGRPRELEYIHEKNGKIIERIAVRGGQLTITSSQEKTAENIITDNEKSAEIAVKSDIDRQLSEQAKTVQKTKKKNVKGFQSGFYITGGIALVCIAFLAFVAWRLKLFRKI